MEMPLLLDLLLADQTISLLDIKNKQTRWFYDRFFGMLLEGAF
jgi:hypothetical protein